MLTAPARLPGLVTAPPVSKAPLSQAPRVWAWRGSPRWSRSLTGWARQADATPTLMAGLVGAGAMVWVGPPLAASGSNCGLVSGRLWLAALKPQVVPSSTLPPPSLMVPETTAQFPPDSEFATMVLATTMLAVVNV